MSGLICRVVGLCNLLCEILEAEEMIKEKGYCMQVIGWGIPTAAGSADAPNPAEQPRQEGKCMQRFGSFSDLCKKTSKVWSIHIQLLCDDVALQVVLVPVSSMPMPGVLSGFKS